MTTSKNKLGRLFWGGIIVGFIVMIGGMVSLLWLEIGITEGRLILCSGLGIIFGAFGSTATIKYKGITITGVAAISIILLYVVVNLTSSQATFGTITGDIKEAQIEIKGDDIYLGANKDRSYEFVIPGNELKRQVFDVYFTFPSNLEGEQEQEINFEGINKKYIEKFLGSGEQIEWRFNRDRQCLVETVTGELIKRIELTPGIASASQKSRNSGLSFVGTALAQQAPRSIEEIFVDLGSGVSSVRREARNELASIGPRAVAAMMVKLKESGSQYRIRLGIFYVLNKMLRDNKGLAQELSSYLSFEDLEIILEALNDPDRTIRSIASEFLYNLGDPRIIEPALSIIDNSRTLETYELSKFVIDSKYLNLSSAARKETIQKLLELKNSLNPLQLEVRATPPEVSRGQKSTIIVTVKDVQGNIVRDANVVIAAGGGKFLQNEDTPYNPRSRLHGPYSKTGMTDMRGKFITWWVCNPCASAYILSVEASKEGYLDARSEIKIQIR